MLVCYTFRRNQFGLACVCALQVISEDKHTHTLPMSCTFFLSWKQRGKEEGYVCTQASVYSCTITQLVPHISFNNHTDTIHPVSQLLQTKIKTPSITTAKRLLHFYIRTPLPPPQTQRKKEILFLQLSFLVTHCVYAHHFCDLALHN